MSKTNPPLEYHAMLSPSGSHKWLACPASVAAERGIIEQSSEFADEGTAAHTLAASCLQNDRDAIFFKDVEIEVGARVFKVTDEFAEYVQLYVSAVRNRIAEYYKAGAVSVTLEVEQRVPIGHITGEEGAEGTSDAVLLVFWPDGSALIDVWDLKFGRGVEVEAENNPQGQLYALGAVRKFELISEFQRVRICIHQPKLSITPSEWEISIAELQAFGEHAKQRAYHALQVLNTEKPEAYIHHMVAGDHCRKAFCKARATCPKLNQFVFDTIAGDFENATDYPAVPQTKEILERVAIGSENVAHCDDARLDNLFPALDIIDDWIRQVRVKIEARLFAGAKLSNVKLVQGKQGNRSWSDEIEAEKALKAMRLKQEEMYTFNLISPTVAEKVLKETPKRWRKIQSLITRKEGKPSVAPISDKRPALEVAPLSDDFEAAPTGSDLT